jgi:hypothetical protein
VGDEVARSVVGVDGGQLRGRDQADLLALLGEPGAANSAVSVSRNGDFCRVGPGAGGEQLDGVELRTSATVPVASSTASQPSRSIVAASVSSRTVTPARSSSVS